MRQIAFGAVESAVLSGVSVTQGILPASLGRQDCLPHSGSIGQCAVLRLHFVVLENDRDGIFALPINVGRLPHNRRVLNFGRSRLTQDRFHLLLRHAFGDLIHVRLRDSLADAAIEHEHEHDQEHEVNDE